MSDQHESSHDSEKNEQKESDFKKARPVAKPKPRAKKKVEPPPPSPKEPLLNQYVQMINKQVGKQALEDAYVNQVGDHQPTLIVNHNDWLPVIRYLKEKHHFVYLHNLSAVDYQTHMEVVCYLYSFIRKERIALRVKLERENARIATMTSLFKAANWHEREMYDLFGIQFEGHPNLTRILMPDDWEGHPLRKDYEPLDKEV